MLTVRWVTVALVARGGTIRPLPADDHRPLWRVKAEEEKHHVAGTLRADLWLTDLAFGLVTIVHVLDGGQTEGN